MFPVRLTFAITCGTSAARRTDRFIALLDSIVLKDGEN